MDKFTKSNTKINLLLVFVFFIATSVNSAGTHNSNKKFTPVSKMSRKDWNDPVELERVWQATKVRVPNGEGKYIATTISKLAKNSIEEKRKYPTVIYMHGCSGVWEGTYTRINLLAKNGFAVIAPVSFARKKYPKSCDVVTNQAGLYRGTLAMRQNDAAFAIENAKLLPWVDSNNVFLMGLSQAGITTATFSSNSENTSVNARVVEDWTCHAGWEEYKGINAPNSEPVLTLVGKNDPWFQNDWTRGDCAKFLNKNNGSKSVVFSDGYLSHQHELLENKEVQATVLEFLVSQIK